MSGLNPYSEAQRVEMMLVCCYKAVHGHFSHLPLRDIIEPPHSLFDAALARQMAIHILNVEFGVPRRRIVAMQARQRTSISFAIIKIDERLECAVFERVYLRDSVQVVRADTEERLKAARELVAAQAKVTASYGPALLTAHAPTLKDMDPTIVGNLRQAFADLNLSIQRGEPDILRFREALSRIAGDASVPESIRKMAQEFRQFDEETLELAKSIPSMVNALDLMEGSANRQTEAINRLSAALRGLSEVGVAPLTELQQAERLWREARRNATNREEVDDADRAYREARKRIDDTNPTITNSDGHLVAVPIPGQKPNLFELEKETDKAADAYRDLIKSANDRVAQMRLEAQISGQTSIAAETLRFELDLLQKAQDKGREVTAQQREQIKGLADDYRAAAEAAAKVKLQQDLMFERDQLFRSSVDQAIATRLRGAGLPIDLQSREAQVIRENMRIAETREAIGSFFVDFRSALVENGGNVGKALGDALATALMNQVNRLTDRIFENLTNALTNAIFGNGSSGGLVGLAPSFTPNTTLGEFLARGAAANDNSPTGDMGLFRKAISAIESGGNYSALGPVTRTGDRAYGRYQVMGNNIGPWSEAALGRRLSASEFLANSSAQDAVFDHRFGSYVSRYGPTGAAKAWFGGPGAVNGNGSAMDVLGTSVSKYADKFNSAVDRMTTSATSATGSFGDLGSGVNTATQGLGQLGNGLGQFGSNLANLFPPAPGGGVTGGGLGTWLGNLWGNLTNGPGTQWAAAVSGNLLPGLFANGGTFMNGISGYSNTIVDRPTLFAFAKGTGLMGEAGPEAIMPLSRDARGRLGVAVNDNWGSGQKVEINIINNAGARVTQRERQTANGKAIDVMIDEAVAQKINTPGSASRGAMQGQFGLKGGLARR
ncbi:hypothetical protein [Mycoplana dimorpha]|uniref:Lambda family phage tail tape measure protein n=1 Tax=Mycoplana dimorpha TaxID=28320 RepID=A0A2T5B1I7_MYCDI|nr:lambda family phage tail tape measure protein [Mycoplana dimorpha]